MNLAKVRGGRARGLRFEAGGITATGSGCYFGQFPQQCFSQQHGSHDSIDFLLSHGDERTWSSARVELAR